MGGSGRHPRRPGDDAYAALGEGAAFDGELVDGVLLERARPEVTSSPAGVVAPSAHDPVVRSASRVIGGPAGRYLAIGASVISTASVLVLLAFVVMGAGVVAKQHCRAQGWSTPDQFWHACYSDIPVLYGSAGLGDAPRPALGTALGETGLGQPPLAAAAMWVVSGVVPADSAAGAGSAGPSAQALAQGQRRFFDLSAVVLALALATGVVLVSRAAGRRPWDAAHLALSPVLVVSGLLSYQLLSVALLCAVLLAWQRQRWGLAGVMLALAAAASPVVSVVGLAVLVVGVRSGRRAVAAGTALVGLGLWLGLRQVLPGVPSLWSSFETWRASAPGYGSIWLAPQLLAESWPASSLPASGLSPSVVTWLSLTGLALVIVLTGAFVVTRPGPVAPRLAPVALILVAGALVVARNVPVQASLLLLPLIAAAGLQWRDHLIWAAAECTYFVGVWLYIGAQSDINRGLPPAFYLVLLVLRLAAIGWLAVQAVRVISHPRSVPGATSEPTSPVPIASVPLAGGFDRPSSTG